MSKTAVTPFTGRKVKSVRFHQATTIKSLGAKNSLDSEANKLTMSMMPMGIHIIGENVDRVVSYNNCYEWDLYPESKD